MTMRIADPDPSDQPGSDFQVDQHGKPIPKSQQNIRTALQKLGVQVRYNEFHDHMPITGLDGHSIIDDAAMHKLWLTIDERFKFLSPLEFFHIVVGETARRNSFHPVCDYLNNLVWDNTSRIDRWLITYGNASDNEYVRAVGAIVLIAAVRRVRKPGCKFDEMLILESAQGLDKSELLKT